MRTLIGAGSHRARGTAIGALLVMCRISGWRDKRQSYNGRHRPRRAAPQAGPMYDDGREQIIEELMFEVKQGLRKARPFIPATQARPRQNRPSETDRGLSQSRSRRRRDERAASERRRLAEVWRIERGRPNEAGGHRPLDP